MKPLLIVTLVLILYLGSNAQVMPLKDIDRVNVIVTFFVVGTPSTDFASLKTEMQKDVTSRLEYVGIGVTEADESDPTFIVYVNIALLPNTKDQFVAMAYTSLMERARVPRHKKSTEVFASTRQSPPELFRYKSDDDLRAAVRKQAIDFVNAVLEAKSK